MLLSLLDQVFYNEVAMYLIGKKKKKKLKRYIFIDELKLKLHLLKITRNLHGVGPGYNLSKIHGFDL